MPGPRNTPALNQPPRAQGAGSRRRAAVWPGLSNPFPGRVDPGGPVANDHPNGATDVRLLICTEI